MKKKIDRTVCRKSRCGLGPPENTPLCGYLEVSITTARDPHSEAKWPQPSPMGPNRGRSWLIELGFHLSNRMAPSYTAMGGLYGHLKPNAHIGKKLYSKPPRRGPRGLIKNLTGQFVDFAIAVRVV